MQKIKRDPYATKLQNFFSAALIAIALVFLQSFNGPMGSDTSGSIAIIAFAIALPLLGATFLLETVESRYEYGPRSFFGKLTYLCYLLGILAAMVGTTAALWRILPIAGIAFMATSILTTVVFGLYILQLTEKPDQDA
jgi:peptidoglycan/LPS O-acetylase OafA/YrhL